MWLPFTLTRHLAPLAACITAIMLASQAHPAYAQSLETAIMPGEVIQGHATYESECKRCHVTDNWRKIIKRDPLQLSSSGQM